MGRVPRNGRPRPEEVRETVWHEEEAGEDDYLAAGLSQPLFVDAPPRESRAGLLAACQQGY